MHNRHISHYVSSKPIVWLLSLGPREISRGVATEKGVKISGMEKLYKRKGFLKISTGLDESLFALTQEGKHT